MLKRMIRLAVAVLAVLVCVVSAQAQSTEQDIRRLVPYSSMLANEPGLTLSDYNDAVKSLARELEGPPASGSRPATPRVSPRTPSALPAFGAHPALVGEDGAYLGSLSSNPFDPSSVSNPYGRYGSKFSPDSVNNPYGKYGSPYSPYSSTNPYATQAPKIVTPGGAYKGRYSANPYSSDSSSNPYGRFGSPYSSDSINNPFGPLGNPYSPSSVTNPFAVTPLAPLTPLPALPGLLR